MENKVLKFKNYKKQLEKKDYYKVLSYNQLINEAHEALNKMGREDADNELLTDTRLLLLEFIARLDKISTSYSKSIYSLKGKIEDLLK
ncbi:MAG: hypothetical protein OEY33_07755 [Bdellovibrionales bacterium]|jgi:predicted metal-dependent hydrolase|nr:hypothetical protein [Bdellovibrionales bacterium]